MIHRQLALPCIFSCVLVLLMSVVGHGQAQVDQLANVVASIPAADPLPRDGLKTQLANNVQRLRTARNRESSDAWRAVQTREQWELYRDAQLNKLAASLGQNTAVPANLNSLVTGRAEFASAGFAIENVLYESRPTLWVSANLYRPLKPTVAAPGILISHAHHTPKEHGELQDMGMTWARAGCYVLVPDHFGHGERRQHPFVSASSYPGSFRLSRQDYYYRYDSGIKLHLLGESLMGWLQSDLSRGVDFLLGLPGIDPRKIILLGSVAGGGDPCAVTAALDKRISAAVPFNFGGPQPETRYPLPEDVETTFNYAGGGSWESTRNLTRSSADGFLPWTIVGGIAPRRLVYAHEFNWDQARDPVWKRLETIYRFYGDENGLAFTHGRGELSGQPPEATHCTHIGAFHRQRMHQAFQRWFGIRVAPDDEYSDRVPAESLRCFPANPSPDSPSATANFLALAQSKIAAARAAIRSDELSRSRASLLLSWASILGHVDANPLKTAESHKVVRSIANLRCENVMLSLDFGIQIPVIFLRHVDTSAAKVPVVLISTHAGKNLALADKSREYAKLLAEGFAICIPDVRGTEDSRVSTSRGRSSSATSNSSSLLMLGDPLLAGQLRDLRVVFNWLKNRPDVDSRQIALWGDSRSPTATEGQSRAMPRDDDSALPPSVEPAGCLLALLLSLFESDINAMCLSGGLTSFASAMEPQQVRLPHDCVVPGLFAAGDIEDLVSQAAQRIPVRIEGWVDGWNVPLTPDRLREYQSQLTLGPENKLSVAPDYAATEWFVRISNR